MDPNTEDGRRLKQQKQQRYMAAAGLNRLSKNGQLSRQWYQTHKNILFARYSECDPATRGQLLSLMIRLSQAWESNLLWQEYTDAMTAGDPIEARALIHAVDQVIMKISDDASGTLMIELMDQLATRSGPAAAMIHHYLVERFGAEVTDSAIFKRLLEANGKKRANLLRFFAVSGKPPRQHIQQLIHFIGDDEMDVRFWAIEHLKNLSGDETFGFDPRQTPTTLEAKKAKESWQQWLDSKYPTQ